MKHYPPATQAKPCQCDKEPFGDEREGVCARCGRGVRGYEVPGRRSAFTLSIGDDRSSYAKPSRKYRPAA